MLEMIFRQLFDFETCTYTYLIGCPKEHKAILIDPVIKQTERDLKLLQELGLTLEYILETHIHADHITGLDTLRSATNAKGAIPACKEIECADIHLMDNQELTVGSITIKVIYTPGHTNHHAAYLINNKVFTGDALLIRGCGRTDFQEGDASALYSSITERLFTLPDNTQVYPAHDYNGQTVSTIGEEKKFNPRVANKSREAFIEIMDNLNLPKPKQIDIAVPGNMRCGKVSEIPANS